MNSFAVLKDFRIVKFKELIQNILYFQGKRKFEINLNSKILIYLLIRQGINGLEERSQDYDEQRFIQKHFIICHLVIEGWLISTICQNKLYYLETYFIYFIIVNNQLNHSIKFKFLTITLA